MDLKTIDMDHNTVFTYIINIVIFSSCAQSGAHLHSLLDALASVNTALTRFSTNEIVQSHYTVVDSDKNKGPVKL